MALRIPTAVAAICLFSTGALAQQQATALAPAQPPKEKKLCRSVVPTGSIMGKRICLTRSEWAEFNAQNDRHNDMFRDNKNKGLRPEDM